MRSSLGVFGLWTGTFIIGLGIAVANVLVVPLIKRDYPVHAARCIGFYAATMALTAALSSGMASPLSALSSATWRVSMGIWVIPAAFALIVWIKVCARMDNEVGSTKKPVIQGASSVWKSGVAWQVSMFMALQTMVFYTLIDWYPSMANTHGVSSSVAGFHLFIYQAVAVLTNLSTAIFIARLRDQRLLGLICPIFITSCVAGLLSMPSVSVLWLILARVCQWSPVSLSLGSELMSITSQAVRESAVRRLSDWCSGPLSGWHITCPYPYLEFNPPLSASCYICPGLFCMAGGQRKIGSGNSCPV